MPRHGQHDEKPAGAPARPADLLRQIPYFAGLDAPTLADVARAVRAREAQAGEHILTEGEPCLGLYFVMRGQVRLMKTAADGREHVLRVLGPSLGNVVKDLALRDVTARVARLLLGCIGQHDHIVEKAGFACARISHQEIAAMVGSVREVVQRALKELERDGAVTLTRTHIDIRDPAKLERWAYAAGGG